MSDHMTPTERLYNLGMQMAYRHPQQDPVTHVALERLERYTKISVDVAHTDPRSAQATATDMFDLLCAKYPRENGAAA